MKKRILLQMIVLFFSMQFLAAQNMVTVNNTQGTAADYKTLQGALDSVASGTIILLQPGSSPYGQVTVRKLVSIIGAGYFLNLNPIPNTQANLAESLVDAIIFGAGSNGSIISGLSFTNFSTPFYVTSITLSNTSDITISRCSIVHPGGGANFITSTSSGNIVFKQCYFFHTTSNNLALAAVNSNNIQFYNCIFDGIGDNVGANLDPATTALLFKNCTFKNCNAIQGNTVTYINNILFNTGSPGSVYNSVAAMNNVGNVVFSSGGNNITNAIIGNTLVLNTDPNIVSPDGKFKLKTGSPAIAFGQGGIDAGAFGGDSSYILSGIPFIPNIYLAETIGIPTNAGGLKLHIKVKANQ